jgi:hypothetical protein
VKERRVEVRGDCHQRETRAKPMNLVAENGKTTYHATLLGIEYYCNKVRCLNTKRKQKL